MAVTTTAADDRTQRVQLLALAPSEPLGQLADELIGRFGPPSVVVPPETGVLTLQVREPACEERFILGEVVVTRCEVDWCGTAGWSMRLGTDRRAALAAAICDAAAMHDRSARHDVDRLCSAVADAHTAADEADWSELARTIVHFEELD